MKEEGEIFLFHLLPENSSNKLASTPMGWGVFSKDYSRGDLQAVQLEDSPSGKMCIVKPPT